MDSALAVHRLHFAFTVTFHYLFPQLTMGLALLIVILKTMALRTGNERYNQAARFWVKIFAINFADRRGDRHPHGISVRHQLGAVFALRRRRDRADAGHGRRLLVLPGVDISGPVRLRREAARSEDALVLGVSGFLGSWLSGFFIIATDAWMQHPVGYRSVQATTFCSQLLGTDSQSVDALAVSA